MNLADCQNALRNLAAQKIPSWNHVRETERLLHQNADSSNGDSVAKVAARCGNHFVLAQLPFKAKWCKDSEGFTPLMEAVKANSLMCTKHLLHLFRQKQHHSEWKRFICQQGPGGKTALDLARENVDRKDLATLIDQEMSLLGNDCNLGNQQEIEYKKLKQLVLDGDLEQVKISASVVTCDLPDESGKTVLMWAAVSPCVPEAVLGFLVGICDPTAVDKHGWTALHFAAGCGFDRAVDILVPAGTPVNSSDVHLMTPLMRAASLKKVGVVKTLLKFGANWELHDDSCHTALYRAISTDGNKDVISILDRYANKSFFEADGSILHRATRAGQLSQANQASNAARDNPIPDRNDTCGSAQTDSEYELYGRGSFGAVYKMGKCKDRCIKIIKLPLNAGNDNHKTATSVKNAIENEIYFLNLEHRNIVKFYNISLNKDQIEIIMEFCPGLTLGSFVENHKQAAPSNPALGIDAIRFISKQICCGLEYLHDKKIIHRDLHSSNILVSEGDLTVKLIDFNISVRLQKSATHFSEVSVTHKGAQNFQAPEVFGTESAESCGRIATGTDIWSLGCNVFLMTTGSVPYHNITNPYHLMSKVVENGAEGMPDWAPDLLKQFYLCCTHKERSQRSTAKHLLLHEFLRDSSQQQIDQPDDDNNDDDENNESGGYETCEEADGDGEETGTARRHTGESNASNQSPASPSTRPNESDATPAETNSPATEVNSIGEDSSWVRPQFLNKLEFHDLLGVGDFSDIFEVMTDSGFKCAAKTIKYSGQIDEKMIRMWRQLCSIEHKNIVNFMWISMESNSNLVAFMELLDGKTLTDQIKLKTLDEEEIALFGFQICSALNYMHSKEPPILHKDINSSNIILLRAGGCKSVVKLIGFDLAQRRNQLSTIGTESVNFMAPELLVPQEMESIAYSTKSDIWAFGCTIYQMVTGCRPYFDCTNQLKLAVKLNKKGAPDLPDSCSPMLIDFYKSCTGRDQKTRKSAAELLTHPFVSRDVGTELL